MIYQEKTLDPFQEQAVHAIDEAKSVLVAAPTGCGKTLIAEYAVDVSIDLKKKVIYTAPIKALSNQKYRDFRRRFGDAMVGIHTGDVSMNPDAPLLIMTTEIFRNLILENSRRLENVHYVIFDEIHYLDDPERGTVWEESIILAPPWIRFICLSATVPNIYEMAQWMATVRAANFVVIEEKVRPIPLSHHLYSAKYGTVNIKYVRSKYNRNPRIRKQFLKQKPSSRKIVHHALHEGHFPILYFCFNRKACERNAEEHMHLDLLNDEERQKVRDLVAEMVIQYRLDGYQRLSGMLELWESGCAYHHAGILPAAKEIVERLFTAGLIKLLFCTETFSLGVNMPASSVIFDQIEKFDGVQFNYLMTREYNQMAGRAGRRGIDEIGHVYSQIIPEATDPQEIERLFTGTNEKIQSRFIASYSTILNLYSRFGEGCFEIFRKSFRNFVQGSFAITPAYTKEEEQIKNRIAFLQASGFLNGMQLTEKGKLAASVNGYEIQAAELYFSRSFDECSEEQLAVVLASLVTEESKRNKAAPQITSVHLKFNAEKVIKKLRLREMKYNIMTPIPELSFSLAAPIFSWARGCSLLELEGFGVPEGDLVRVLRMTIQLMRTLRDLVPDPVIADRMHQTIARINRDVVDAQAELEVR